MFTRSAGAGTAERDDLAMLAVAVLVVPLTWLVFLGWSWPQAIFGYDDLGMPGLLAIREMVETGEGWSSLVYRPDLLGGAKVANVNGRFPLYVLGARLGLSPVGVYVVSGFIVHALLGFLGCRAAADLTLAWSDRVRRLTVSERVAVVWLCAFAPVLGWRFGIGHPAVVIGLLPFAAALVLIIASASGTHTISMVVVTTAALVLGLLHVSQQLVVYSAVFGGPVLLGIWIGLGAAWRRLALPALVAVAALLIALPALWGILVQGHSSDSPRVLGGTMVTYNLLTSTAHDWITSLPWMLPALPPGFRSVFAHEVNYPVGPLVVLLVLVPWRRAWALGVGLAVSLLLIVSVSMDLAPVSRALLAAVPPLQVFRVPARAALVWLWVLPVVATAALLHRDAAGGGPAKQRWSTWATALALPLCATVLFLPAPVRDVSGAALVLAACGLVLLGRPSMPVALVLVVLGLFSVAAFKERLPLPHPDPQPLLATAERIGAGVRAAMPTTVSSLSRVRLDVEVPGFHSNTAFAARLSSLDGYAIPTRRFSELVYALRGHRFDPTGNIFQLPADDPAFGVLRQLYNVTDRVTLASSPDHPLVTPLGPTAGPAWFSASVSRVDDLAGLVRELRSSSVMLHSRVHQVLWHNATDPLVMPAVPQPLDERCRDAAVTSVSAARHGADIVAHIETPALCPLTFATNFTEDLRATAVLVGGRRMAVQVFPSYGALASVVAPGGATAIHLHAEPVTLPWSVGWLALGVACCAGAAWQTRREARSPALELRRERAGHVLAGHHGNDLEVDQIRPPHDPLL